MLAEFNHPGASLTPQILDDEVYRGGPNAPNSWYTVNLAVRCNLSVPISSVSDARAVTGTQTRFYVFNITDVSEGLVGWT